MKKTHTDGSELAYVRIISISLVICSILILAGCSKASEEVEGQPVSASQVEAESDAEVRDDADNIDAHQAHESSSQSYTGGWGLVSDDFIEWFVERYDELESTAIEELEDRKNASPIHAALGDEVEATGNLAVSVLSVEPGPYDYADNTPTMKVTVAMRNLTNKAISVKASNWDADNGNGQRVDHKLYIKDERGKRDLRSFEPTKVSPNATFTGVVYFDGKSLSSVIYEPHWLVSSQNQYIYFDL